MGPFPHDAPPALITADNPAGTDGFEFVEFAHPEPEKLEELFTRMGYSKVATHRSKAIAVWRQGDINYVVNAEPGSHAMKFAGEHGPCAASMAWRVVDAQHAFAHAVSKGAKLITGGKELGGLFFEPGVLTGVTTDMIVARVAPASRKAARPVKTWTPSSSRPPSSTRRVSRVHHVRGWLTPNPRMTPDPFWR